MMEKLVCKKCEYAWFPRKENIEPLCCPRCKSYKWNKEEKDAKR